MMDGCRLREGIAADLDAVLAVQRESASAPQWSEAVWRGLLQTPASAEPMRRLFLVEDEECIAGYMVVMLAGDMAEIESVAVALAYRRHGLGSMLCRYAMQWSAERGATGVALEVRAQNLAARALYGSLGFAEQGIRKGYYRQPDDDAVLLAAVL